MMDPNGTLIDIRMMAGNLIENTSPHGDAHEGRCLAESVRALDASLANGGNLPAGWNTARHPLSGFKVVVASDPSAPLRALDDAMGRLDTELSKVDGIPEGVREAASAAHLAWHDWRITV